MAKSNSFIAWQGPSQIDGSPIMLIVSGFAKPSANGKTGDMLQTFIIRSDIDPVTAAGNGMDYAICGNCPHRAKLLSTAANGSPVYGERSCYVLIFQAPLSVYGAFKRGNLPTATPDEVGAMAAGRDLRLGTYGDPAAVPLWVWLALLRMVSGHTGYSHQWRNLSADWRRLVMASADSVADMEEAHSAGWRTFRVTAKPGQEIRGKEAVCPASAEKGKVTDCATCKACMGTSSKARVSIAIAAHSPNGKNFKESAA